MDKVGQVAFEEGLIKDLSSDYNALRDKLNTLKNDGVDNNRVQLTGLLENEIIKRYFYREGLYEYYLINNEEIQKASEILGNLNTYRNYLN